MSQLINLLNLLFLGYLETVVHILLGYLQLVHLIHQVLFFSRLELRLLSHFFSELTNQFLGLSFGQSQLLVENAHVMNISQDFGFQFQNKLQNDG